MTALIKAGGSWAVNRFLSELLEGVTPDNITASFASGEFGINNIQLKTARFNELESPILIQHVSLGDIRLTIPALWKILKEPIKVKIEKLFVVIAAKEVSKLTIDERKKMMKATKQLALFVFGMTNGAPIPDEYVDKAAQEAATKKLLAPELFGLPGLVKKFIPIVDNVQIEIANIHVRYEDGVANPINPFALGICLDNVQIKGSTTQTGEDTFVTEWNIDNYRKLKLNNFSIYLDTDGIHSAPIQPPNYKQDLNSQIYKSDQTSKEVTKHHHMFLQPLSIGIGAQWHRGFDVKVPMIQANVSVPHLGLTVSNPQLMRVMDATANLKLYFSRLKYGYTAVPTESPLMNPKAWWQFAIGCVIKRIRHKMKKWDPAVILQRSTDRLKYINIVRKEHHLGGAWLLATEKQDKEALEKKLKVRDVLEFGKVAKLSVLRDVKTERIKCYGSLDKIPSYLKIGALGALIAIIILLGLIFFRWPIAVGAGIVLAAVVIFGLRSKIFSKPEIAEFDDSPASWAWIYDQIGYNTLPKPKGPESSKFPAEYDFVRAKINVSRMQADLTLIGTRPFDSSILTLGIDKINIDAVVKEGPLSLGVEIDTINAVERISLSQRQPLHLISHVLPSADVNPEAYREGKFVKLALQIKPVDRPGIDLFIGANTTTFNVNASIPFVSAAMGFFIPPYGKRREVQDVAARGIQRVALAAKDRVQAAIRDRQCIQMDIIVHGPTITIAQSYKPKDLDSRALFVHTGKIKITSNPNRADNHVEYSETDCFDCYETSVNDMAIVLACGNWHNPETAYNLATQYLRSIDTNAQALEVTMPSALENTRTYLIDRSRVTCRVYVCIAGQVPEYPATRVVAQVDGLKVITSPSRIQSILAIFGSQFTGPIKSSKKSTKAIPPHPALAKVPPNPDLPPAGAEQAQIVAKWLAGAAPAEDNDVGACVPRFRAAFIGEFIVRHVIVEMVKDAYPTQPESTLASITIVGIESKVDLNLYVLSIGAKVGQIAMEEFTSDTAASDSHLSSSEGSPAATSSHIFKLEHPVHGALSVGLKLYPKESPMRRGSLTEIVIDLGNIDVVVSRPALLLLMRQALQFIPTDFVMPDFRVIPALPTLAIEDLLSDETKPSEVPGAKSEYKPEKLAEVIAEPVSVQAYGARPGDAPEVPSSQVESNAESNQVPSETPKPAEEAAPSKEESKPELVPPKPVQEEKFVLQPIPVESITHAEVQSTPSKRALKVPNIDDSVEVLPAASASGNTAHESSSSANQYNLTSPEHGLGDDSNAASEADQAILYVREPELIMQILLRATVPSVTIAVIRENAPIFTFGVNTIKTAVTIRGDGKLGVNGHIQKLSLQGAHPTLGIQNMMINEGTAIGFGFGLFPSHSSDYPEYDMMVAATVGGIKFTYFHAVIMGLVSWSLKLVDALQVVLNEAKPKIKALIEEQRKSRKANRRSISSAVPSKSSNSVQVPSSSTVENSEQKSKHPRLPSTEEDLHAVTKAEKKLRRKSKVPSDEVFEDEFTEDESRTEKPKRVKKQRKTTSQLSDEEDAIDSSVKERKKSKLKREVSAPDKKSRRSKSSEVAATKVLRIKISATINSPVLVIPTNPSNKRDGELVVNLGVTKICNDLTEVGSIHLDTLTADVSHLHVVFSMPAASIEDDPQQAALLNHTGLKAVVQRVLGGDDEHAFPTIGVDCELKPVQMQFGTSQIHNVFQLLSKHILIPVAEDVELDEYFNLPTSSEKAAAAAEASSIAAQATIDKLVKYETEIAGKEVDPLKPSADSWVNIRVAARIPQFVFDVNDASNISVLRLGVSGIGALFMMSNDAFIGLEANFGTIEIFDPFANPEHFTQFFGKPTNVVEPMIKVGFIMNPNTNAMGVNAHISSPTIVVLPEAIVRIKEALMDAAIQGAAEMKSALPPPSPAPQPPPIAVVVPSPAIHCRVKIDSPRLILIPGSSHTSTKSFAMNLGEIGVSVFLNPTKKLIDAEAIIKNFRMVKAVIEAKTLISTGENLLIHPMELISTAHMDGPKMDISATIPIFQFISSFRDVKLIMQILESFNPVIKTFTPPPQSGTGTPKDSDLASSTQVTSTADTTDIGTETLSYTDSSQHMSNLPAQQQISISLEISTIDIGFVDDRFKNDFFLPLLRFALSPLKGKVGKSVGASGELAFGGIQAYVYNKDFGGWEPTLEPWEMAFEFTQDEHGGIAARLHADSILNLNINHSLLVSIFELLEIVVPPRAKNKKHQAIKLRSVEPFIVRNFTGVTAQLQLDGTQQPFTIPAGEVKAVELPRGTRAAVIANPPTYRLTVLVEGASSPAKISANRVDTIVVPYQVEDADSIYISEIATVEGSRTVTLRGSYKVINQCPEPVELLVIGGDGNASTIDSNGGTFCSSIGLSEKKAVQLRPVGYDWSESISFHDPKLAYLLTCKGPSSSSGIDWYATAKVDVQCDGSDYVLVISPPVVVENLFTVPMDIKLINLKREKELAKAHKKVEKSSDKKSKKDADGDASDDQSEVPVVGLDGGPTWTISEADSSTIHKLPAFSEALAIAAKIPNYGWSKPVSIVNKINAKRIAEKYEADIVFNVVLELPDAEGNLLKVGVDVATTDTMARHVKIYATSWIINNTGLNLFFKRSPDESRIAAGQQSSAGYACRMWSDSVSKKEKTTQPNSALDNPNQQQWYTNAEKLISVAVTSPASPIPSSGTQTPSSSNKEHSSSSLPGYGPYYYYGEKRLSIALENSDWSASSDLGVHDEGTIEIEDAATGRLYSFFISVRPAPARFWRTSIVRIYPKFVLSNATPVPIICRQLHESHEAPSVLLLEPGQQLPYHWPSYKMDPIMVVHNGLRPALVSSVFGLDEIGRFPLKLHDTSIQWAFDKSGKKLSGAPKVISSLDQGDFDFASLAITNAGDSSIFVRFLPDAADEFFCVWNQTNQDIIVREHQQDSLDPLKLLKKKQMEEATKSVVGVTESAAEHSAAAGPSDAPAQHKSEKELAKEKKAAEKAAKEAEKAIKEAEKKAAKEAEKKKTIDDQAAASSVTDGEKDKKKKKDEPPIHVSDSDAEAMGCQTYIIKAKRKEAFTFGRPQYPKHKVQFKFANDPSGTWYSVNLDKIDKLPSVKYGSKYIRMNTIAEGQAKELVVKLTSKGQKTVEQEAQAAAGAKMSFKLEMAGMGISVIDRCPQELMYVYMEGLRIDASMTSLEQQLDVQLGKLQIDNDLYLTPKSIILHSLDQPKDDPVFHLAMVRDLRYQKFLCFRYFSMKLHKLATGLDMAFALNAMCWALSLTKWIGQRTSAEIEHGIIIGEGEGKIKIPVVKATDNGFYFEVFHINAMAFQITFMPTYACDCPQMDDAAAELIAKINPHLVTIDEAPLTLAGLLIKNCFSSQEEFVARLTSHYVKSVLKQLLMFVGSSDMLGNPVSLVNSLGTGVFDLVHEPAQGLTQSPAAFGVGLAKGTGSLLKNSLGGVLQSAEKLVGNVSRLGEKLSMDKEYQREREQMKMKKAHHVGTGLTYGFKELGTGIFQGVSGLVTQPVKGAKKHGLKGFGKGIGKGLVGVVVKPTVGVVDLVTRTSEGIRNTGSSQQAVPRIRDPRYFGPNLLLSCYDAQKAQGQLFLRTLSDGKYKKEFYVYHNAPTPKTSVLITNLNVMYLKQNPLEKIAIQELWGIDWRQPLLFFSENVVIDETKKRLLLTEKVATGAAFLASSTAAAGEAVEDSTAVSITTGISQPSQDLSKSPNKSKPQVFKIKYDDAETAQAIREKLFYYIREAPVSRPRAKALGLLGKINPFGGLLSGGSAEKNKKSTKPTLGSSTETTSAAYGEVPSSSAKPTPEKSEKTSRRRSVATGEFTPDDIAAAGNEPTNERKKSVKRAESLAPETTSKDGVKEKEKRKSKRQESLNLGPSQGATDPSTKSPRKGE